MFTFDLAPEIFASFAFDVSTRIQWIAQFVSEITHT